MLPTREQMSARSGKMDGKRDTLTIGIVKWSKPYEGRRKTEVPTAGNRVNEGNEANHRAHAAHSTALSRPRMCVRMSSASDCIRPVTGLAALALAAAGAADEAIDGAVPIVTQVMIADPDPQEVQEVRVVTVVVGRVVVQHGGRAEDGHTGTGIGEVIAEVDRHTEGSREANRHTEAGLAGRHMERDIEGSQRAGAAVVE